MTERITKAKYDELKSEHERFRAEVARVAYEAKVHNGWCDEIDEMLAKVGLDINEGRKVHRLTFTVDVELEGKDGPSNLKDWQDAFAHNGFIDDLPYGQWSVDRGQYAWSLTSPDDQDAPIPLKVVAVEPL